MKLIHIMIVVILLGLLNNVYGKTINPRNYAIGCFHNGNRYAVVPLGQASSCPAYQAHMHANSRYKATTPLQATAGPTTPSNDNSEDPHCILVTAGIINI